MTDNKDNMLVRRFFDEHPVNVPDDGFSRRVMRRLPDRERLYARLWTAFSIVAVIASLTINGGFATLKTLLHTSVAGIVERCDLLQHPLLAAYAVVLVVSTCVCGLLVRER